MKPYEAREMTHAELVEKLDEAQDDLFNLRFQLAVSQSDNTARLGELRRDIARMRTVLNEWERDGRPLGYEAGAYEREGPPVDEPVAVPDFPEDEEPAVAEAEEETGEVPEEAAAVAASDEREGQPDDSPAEPEPEEPKRGRRWGLRSRK